MANENSGRRSPYLGDLSARVAEALAEDPAGMRDAIGVGISVGEVNAADPKYGTPGTRTAFLAALAAAETLGKHSIVRVPAGLTIDVVTGLSLSGYSVQLRGAGAGLTGTTPAGSVIKASAQTGPVLDFTGYVPPSSFKGRVTPLADVAVVGSNVADATKANSGVRLTAMSSATFRDIAIMNTGGPGLECASSPGNAVYLCDFERIVISTPVSAKANDVPYFYANEPNGNRFRGFGFRSMLSAADVGASGAAVIEGNGSFTGHDNLFDGWWYENLHVPTNGTLFHHAGNSSVIRDFQFFDCLMESGAAGGTSFWRLAVPTVNNQGGNILQGIIMGDNGVTTYIDTGVDVRQSRNRIVGVRGYRSKNVTLAAGVDYTYAHLAGSVSNAFGAPSAFVDNSGATHNTLVDELNGDEFRSGAYMRQAGVTAGGPTDVQTFTASGTWTKPALAKVVEVTIISGGGGGGSGRRGAPGSVRCGGGGGGGGGVTIAKIPAASLGSTVAVTVGTGGAGGAAVTADDTDGANGGNGGISSFGTNLRAGTGASSRGSGGTATTGTGGGGGFGNLSGAGTPAGGSASGTGAAGNVGVNGQYTSGAGAGGGITSGNVAANGGAGGQSPVVSGSAAPAGGVVDTTVPGAGLAQPAGSGLAGSGGGGGAASITTAAQAGGAGGIYGGPGGGGGASTNGFASGAGGAGADGIVIVATFF